MSFHVWYVELASLPCEQGCPLSTPIASVRRELLRCRGITPIQKNLTQWRSGAEKRGSRAGGPVMARHGLHRECDSFVRIPPTVPATANHRRSFHPHYSR